MKNIFASMIGAVLLLSTVNQTVRAANEASQKQKTEKLYLSFEVPPTLEEPAKALLNDSRLQLSTSNGAVKFFPPGATVPFVAPGTSSPPQLYTPPAWQVQPLTTYDVHVMDEASITRPDPTIDFKILVIQPDPSVEYKIRVIDPKTKQEIPALGQAFQQVLPGLLSQRQADHAQAAQTDGHKDNGGSVSHP